MGVRTSYGNDPSLDILDRMAAIQADVSGLDTENSHMDLQRLEMSV